MSYKSKLERFNSTDKYENEMLFMIRLINPLDGMPCILDYGCGTGYMVKRLDGVYGNTCGYDVGLKYLKYDKDDIFFDELNPDDKYDHIYFMHSIAHIPNLETRLNELKELLCDTGRIHVITPNKIWLDNISKNSYEPDDTVVKHFTPLSLENLFLKCNYAIEYQGQFGTIMGDQSERLFLTASKYS